MKNPRATIAEYILLQERGQVEEGTLLESLVLFYKWLFAGYCIIRDIYANQVPLKPNRAQQVLLAKMMQQAAQGRPVRIVTLKARKTGISTLVQALYFFLCAHFPHRRAITLAHEKKASEEIFDIARLIGECYIGYVDANSHIREIDFPGIRSHYSCRTAGGQGVGAGGTPNYLHLSEVPKWAIRKAENDLAATNSVPDTNPDTIIIYESTAQGRELFWNKFEAAAKPENPYDQVFIPWYLDEKLTAPVAGYFVLSDDERDLIASAVEWGVELSLGALQWRRNKIAIMGIEDFRQEYPSTPDEAVQASKGIILPGLRGCIIDRLPFNIDMIEWTQRVGGIDYGYFDATVISTGVYVDQVLYVIDIYHRIEALADDHSKFLHEGHTYYMDPSATMGRAEMTKSAARLGIRARIVPCPAERENGKVVSPQLKKMSKLIREGRFKILSTCADRLLAETDTYAWNPKTGEPNDARTVETGHYDTIASNRYMVIGTLSRDKASQYPDDHKMLRRDSLRVCRARELANV